LNLKQPYEILIADKLEGLPVPDTADAIWARIELELDADASGDGNGDATEPAEPAHPNTKGVATKTIAIIGGGLLALVVLFFIIKKNTKRTEDKELQSPTKQTDTQKVPQQLPATVPDTVQYMQPATLPKTVLKPIDSSASYIDPVLRNDDAFQLPPALPEKDSAVSLNVAPRIGTSIDSSLLITVPKKPRGIQIPDNGYKMKSSKRDSL